MAGIIFSFSAENKGPAKISKISNWNRTIASPALSPDGRTLGFASTVDGFDQVFVMLTSGSEPLQLTHDEGNKIVLNFSANSRELYFTPSIGSPPIWAIPVLGGTPRPTTQGYRILPSADGQWLFIVKPNGEIVRVPTAGTEEEVVASFPNEPRVSSVLLAYPDGSALLIASARGTDGVIFRRLDISKHQVQVLGELPQGSPRICWATPGKSVYLARNVNEVTNLWEYSLADHWSRQLTYGPGPDRNPMRDASGNGPYFVNGKHTGTRTLYRPNSRQFSNVLAEDATQPEFSMDGRRLAYILHADAHRSEIWASDIDGSNRVKLVSSGPNLETLAWSNDDRKFLYAEHDGSQWKLFLVNSDGTHVQELRWNGEFAGFAVFERGDQSVVLGGQDTRGIVQKSWRLQLDGSLPTLLFENCGMAADVTVDRQFYLTSTLWTEDSSISEYSMADKKCTVLKPKLATYPAVFARDGKSFYYSVAAHGETTIFRQPWHNGVLAGPSVPAVKLPFAIREDCGGNAFAVSPDLSAVVFARPNSFDDLYLLSRP